MIDTPTVDWLALAPALALLGAAGLCLLGAVLVPRLARRPFSAVVCAAGFVTAAVLEGVAFDRSPEAESLIAATMVPDRVAI